MFKLRIFKKKVLRKLDIPLTTKEKDRLIQVVDLDGNLCYAEESVIDRTPYIKLYDPTILCRLSSGSIKLLPYIMDTLDFHRHTIIIYYTNYLDYCVTRDLIPISESTFKRGISNLKKHNVIKDKDIPHVYFVNWNLFFKGSRVLCIKNDKGKDYKLS